MIFFSIFQHGPLFLLPWVATILITLGVHEFAHALAGYLQGDHTAEQQGRLTLNPLAHVDWVGFAMLLLIGFGWGKPTPFNPRNLKFQKWGSTLVAFAGPLSNIIMAIIAILVYKALGFTNLSWVDSSNLLEAFVLFMMQINVVLAVFNLIPIPPLDGSKFLYAFISHKNWHWIERIERNGPFLLIAFIIFGQGILDFLISFVLIGLWRIFGIV